MNGHECHTYSRSAQKPTMATGAPAESMVPLERLLAADMLATLDQAERLSCPDKITSLFNARPSTCVLSSATIPCNHAYAVAVVALGTNVTSMARIKAETYEHDMNTFTTHLH